MADKNIIELIKVLRDRTGAGMMDCKKALESSDLDVEKAIDYLREKGVVKAAKKSSRVAAEGLAAVKIEGNKALIVEVNCETDFVSASDRFHDLVTKVTETLLEKEPKSLEEARELTNLYFTDATVAMGEKFDLRRFEVITKKDGEGFASYIHMGGKIAVLAVLSKESELAKPIAMSIAANNPSYCTLDDVPEDVRQREISVATEEVKNDPKLANKPENIKEGIILRKVDKNLSASCFYLQRYIMDENVVVGDLLKQNDLSVVRFLRYQVGEGIEKPATEEE